MPPTPVTQIAEFFQPALWAQWVATLDRGFLFLLILPFVVAVIGLWAAYLDDRRDDD